MGEALGQIKLTRDPTGVWSVTTPPLPPDYYSYLFVVDGTTIADPANTLSKSIATGGHESLVHVRGPLSLPWEAGAAPHGSIHRISYFAKEFHETRFFYVYTPPGYNYAKPAYPVLYLLHGVLEDETAWVSAGRADTILDNLIAQHKIKPMLVVMPLGYGFANVPDRMTDQFSLPAKQKEIMDAFFESLRRDIMPKVEAGYHVERTSRGRAIAGASMGGAQALYIGLNHPELFGWVGSFSGAIIMYGSDLSKWFSVLGPYLNAKLRLLALYCGTADFLLTANRHMKDFLKASDVHFYQMETPGAHTWNVWRRNLIDFLNKLFS